jgi:DNA (cytosine-5)-methyltransferase 1
MKFIELFAGIGGFRLGLEKAGHECVYANEWLEKPASIYEKNFGDKPDTRDIRAIDPFSIPDADLICGGFPCATFSIAGKREGIYGTDTRGTLFFEICRIAAVKKTPYLFLENVKGLLNHDNGKTFAVILFSLDKLGYDVQWELLNSRNFGVPQNRERIFIIANLRGVPRPKVFPIGKCSSKIGLQNQKEQNKRERVQSEINSTIEIGTLCNRLYGGDTNNFYLESGVAGAVDAHCYKGGSTRTHVEQIKSVESVLVLQKEQKSNIRQLTPLECERLQGLPDNWTKWYADGKGVPDKERYERCGRTVTINVIYEISKRLGFFY